ncbi:non-homologous end-joining DNA ligase [Egibacter rhizosphaerae]|uniref:non-homologous end-joining DNA ligase n=1 Tax=Egibacter rhizosphaerae TaxID=1670831 RepID=UPI0013F1482F|nr:non-homologous end-joining DNA ligase [Egibacter rhizosphaerae]
MSGRADASRPGLSSPDKVLWPPTSGTSAVTKADLHDYYRAVADRLLPAIDDRPVTLRRYPDGIEREGFFQKDVPDHAPAEIGRYRQWSDTSEREVAYALLASKGGLAWCAQVAALELHAGLVRIDRPDRPDALTVDLDPGTIELPVARAAHWVRDELEGLGLTTRVKTSGKRGLHVQVPIERRYDSAYVRAVALALCRHCAARHPDELTVEMRKAHRGGRLLLDWSRNTAGQTVVAPWSPRAAPGAPVATPLRWEEVDEAFDPARFRIGTVESRADPWSEAPGRQRLEGAARALDRAGFPLVDVSPRGGRPTEERLRGTPSP